MRHVVSALALMLVVSACEHAGPLEPEESAPTLESIQASIFNASCAISGCHQGGSAPLGLDLSAGNARGNLVGVPSEEVPELLRVEPGNPDDSYLIIKLEGGDRMTGARMPLNMQALAPDQIQLVRDWIAAGAE